MPSTTAAGDQQPGRGRQLPQLLHLTPPSAARSAAHASVASISMYCAGRANRRASVSGTGTSRPISGSTISRNLAGCAVETSTQRRSRAPRRCESLPGLRSGRGVRAPHLAVLAGSRRGCVRGSPRRSPSRRSPHRAGPRAADRARAGAPCCSGRRHPLPRRAWRRSARGCHVPLARKSGTVRLALCASTTSPIGSPNLPRPETGERVAEVAARHDEGGGLAMATPHLEARSPRNSTVCGSSRPRLMLLAEDSASSARQLRIEKRLLHQPLAVIERAAHRERANVAAPAGELPLLRRARRAPSGRAPPLRCPRRPWKAAATAPPVSPEVATRIVTGRAAPARSRARAGGEKPRAEVLEGRGRARGRARARASRPSASSVHERRRKVERLARDRRPAARRADRLPANGASRRVRDAGQAPGRGEVRRGAAAATRAARTGRRRAPDPAAAAALNPGRRLRRACS